MITDLMTESWEDISGKDLKRLVVFLGIAPIEEHGKHLPVGVDVYETKCWMDGAVRLLDQEFPDYCFGILPVIPLGFADMGAFPGNIHVSKKLIYDVVYETVNAIAGWGVSNIVVISAHADPCHAIAVEQACEKVNETRGSRAFAPMRAIFQASQSWEGQGLSPELKAMYERFPNDFHAGWIETSCMLSIFPDYVKTNYRERPGISLEGRDMMDSRKVQKAIEGEGHIGFPGEASSQLGYELNEDMYGKIKEAVRL